MNLWLPQNLVECLGWTLLHFLWQGLVIAALLGGGLRLLRNPAPNHRYLAGCLALLLLAVAPAITVDCVLRQYQLPAVAHPAADPASISANTPVTQNGPPTKFIFTVKPSPHKLDFAQRVERFLPLIVIGWLAGVVVLSFRLLAGWLQIKRLTRIATAALDPSWQRKLLELGQRLGLERPVRLLQSALVEVPTVIGWLRPVILLPASCLVGLTPGQLESILAHELAHIRRHDYLVNLLQSVVETFLFYHPAVWWVSRKVREEREHCCDDLAVEICGDRLAYARALATLEELRAAPAQLALAAASAPLLQRIRRLAGQPRGNAPRPAWPVLGIMILLMLVGLATLRHGNRAEADESVNGLTNAPALQPQPQNTNSFYQPNTNLVSSHKTIHTGPGRAAIISKLDRIYVDTLEYDNLPLKEVINNLGKIAKSRDPDHIGINFFIDRPVPAAVGASGGIDPVTGESVIPVVAGQKDITAVRIKINPALHNVCLSNALDAIVLNAEQPIHFSVLEYAVKFSWGKPPIPLETRAFHVASNIFLRAWVPGINAANTNSYSQVRQILTSLGMDLDTNNPANAGKMFVWKDKRGILLLRSTAEELDLVGAGIEKLNTPISNAESNSLPAPQAPVLAASNSVPQKAIQESKIPTSIATNTAPKKQFNLKMRMIEIDATKNRQAGLDWLLNTSPEHFSNNRAKSPKSFALKGANTTNALSAVSNSIILQVWGVLTKQQLKEKLEAFEQIYGADILILPEVTTESDRQTQVMAGDVTTIVTGLELSSDNNGKPKAVYKTETLAFGPAVDLVPQADANEKIDLKVIASATEFLGYYGPKGTAITVASLPDPLHAVLPMPRFRVRELSTEATVEDGETLVLGGEEAEKVSVMKTKKNFQTTLTTKIRKNLLVFVTPTIINPDGTPLHKPDEESGVMNNIPSVGK